MPRRKPFIEKIRDLKAKPGKRVTLAVPGAEGLYVRVGSRDKVFTIIARQKKDRKQIWSAVPVDGIDMDTITEEELDVVRALAREGVARIKRGDTPFPPPPAGPDSLRKIGANFMRRHVRKEGLVSGDEVKRHLTVYVYPVLGDRPTHEIRRSDIANLLDQIEDEHSNSIPSTVPM